MQYVSLAAPPPERGMFARGALAVTLAQREHRAAGASRLHLVMRLPRPAWGSLNITGDVRGWSFTDVLSQARPEAGLLVYICGGQSEGYRLHLCNAAAADRLADIASNMWGWSHGRAGAGGAPGV